MNDHPHFTASQFIRYLAAHLQVSPESFGVRPDVVISYLGQLPAIADQWGLSEAPARFHGMILCNDRLALMKGPVGAPAAANLLEELAALGAERIWVLGYAGSLDPHWSLGDVAWIARAWSDEGTSAQYGRSGWAEASPQLAARLRGAVGPASLWTTDAIYRETPRKIDHFHSIGCHLVDMETSCYFHIGEILGVHVAAVMVVTDELYHPWNPGFGSPPVLSGVAQAYGLIGGILSSQP